MNVSFSQHVIFECKDTNEKIDLFKEYVDFDRTRHLSDKEIKKREIEKLKIIELEKIKNAQIEKEKEQEVKKKEIENFRMLFKSTNNENADEASNFDLKKQTFADENLKEQRRREREEIRRKKRLAKKQEEEEKKLELKIAIEERKILIAQRKLESMRLLEELFNRVKVNVLQEEVEKIKNEIKNAEIIKREQDLYQEKNKKIKHDKEDIELKEKILKNVNNEHFEESLQIKLEDTKFELRKSITEQIDLQNQLNSNQETFNQHSMPRSVLLSNIEFKHNTTNNIKLYDEDISILNSDIIENNGIK